MIYNLDRYIEGKNLTDHELQYMYLNPLKMFAYKIKGENNYERAWGMLAIIQRTYNRMCVEEVFYLINHTALTKWQKFKLKFSYLFL